MLTIVTTCKGRLSYLKRSLPSMIGAGLPVVVVDYDCPDGTSRYVEEHFSGVKVVRIRGKAGFNLSEARNLGAAAVFSKYIGFFDSDVLVDGSFAHFLRSLPLSEETFYVAGKCDLHGQCVVSKAAFDKVGGYDEAIADWGGEDGDFYQRLQAIGYRREALAAGMVTALRHGDDERTKFTGGLSPERSHRHNVAYAVIKRDLESLVSGGPLHIDDRRKIRELVMRGFSSAEKTGRPYVIECELPRELGDVDYLLNGTRGYLLGRVMHYEIARLSPSVSVRLLAAIREGRILSGLRRRIQAMLTRWGSNS